MQIDQIDISGLDKAELLCALARRAPLAGFHKQMGTSPKIALEDARAAISADHYIDYFAGRPIKCDFAGDRVDPRLYDRDSGSGAFKQVVAAMRKAAK